MTETTPKHVADQATQKGVFQRKSVSLIGVAGPADALTALILLSGGKVVKAKAGDTTPVGTVLAVSKDAVVLRRLGRDVTLNLPG